MSEPFDLLHDRDPRRHRERSRRTPGRWGLWFGVLVVGAALVAACGGDDGGSGSAGAAGADGAQLYAKNCALCHGVDLRGTAMGPSQLSVVYEPNHHSDYSFRTAIRNGVNPHHWDFGPMPAVTGLDEAEIAAIIAYVRTIQQREGFEPYPPG